jgi:DNA-binding transcriptional LysR family regulator
MSSDLDGARRQINSDATRAAARELQQVSSHAAANLEQTPAAKLIKLHQARHPRRVFRVTMALYALEKLARPELVLAIVFGATWILGPLFARAEFFFSKSAHSHKEAQKTQKAQKS